MYDEYPDLIYEGLKIELYDLDITTESFNIKDKVNRVISYIRKLIEKIISKVKNLFAKDKSNNKSEHAIEELIKKYNPVVSTLPLNYEKVIEFLNWLDEAISSVEKNHEEMKEMVIKTLKEYMNSGDENSFTDYFIQLSTNLKSSESHKKIYEFNETIFRDKAEDFQRKYIDYKVTITDIKPVQKINELIKNKNIMTKMDKIKKEVESISKENYDVSNLNIPEKYRQNVKESYENIKFGTINDLKSLLITLNDIIEFTEIISKVLNDPQKYHK